MLSSLRRTPITRRTLALSLSSHSQYDHKSIEAKWQRYWEENDTFRAVRNKDKPKKYVLDMFPYPSGAGLHVGHPEGYTASDIMARYWRMKGYDVLHPMGWDSFGLPAEQYAIQTGTPPDQTTKTNIATFKRQLKSLGFSFDWSREIATTHHDYVKWTQWIFLQLYKAGLATQSDVLVNWCPALGTVLANEEVIDGLSERGNHPVTRVPLRQWLLRITQYADELEQGLASLDWPEGTLAAQKSWIGRSEGAEIDFETEGGLKFTVFTTRPDTLFGVTYVVLAPENPLVMEIIESHPAHAQEVRNYVEDASRKSDIERLGSNQAKSGVFSGARAIHPLTGESVPVWVADYVLGGYGTGAVMAVPAHDQRDFEFAEKHGLPVKRVVGPDEPLDEAFSGLGTMLNSGRFDGMGNTECATAVISELESQSKGRASVQYKLRDWTFSRQRYWGEPIPIYFPVDLQNEHGDPRNGDEYTIRYDQPIPVEESELPLLLPEMDDYQPGNDPAGCLARAADWRFFQKSDGKWFARETNTMPQWAGSCWYYLRFTDPRNTSNGWSFEADKDWMPVDLYVGGQEHAVLHLLYARFWHKVLHKLGHVSTPEPFQKLVHQGMILGEDGEKMSKSRGNVINPDDVIAEHGADALRLYEMFMGPLEAVKAWQIKQVSGVVRFRNRVFNLYRRERCSHITPELAQSLHKTMKKVSNDIEKMQFNTAISSMMILVNELNALDQVPEDALEKLALMLSPFAPHVAEECWALLGHPNTLAYEPWVEWDETLCVEDTVTVAVQVNGKLKGTIQLSSTEEEESARAAALRLPDVANSVSKKPVKRFIYRPGKIINIVV